MKAFFSPPLTGRHALLMFVAFFGIVFAVNGILIYRSLSTWTGLEQDNAYIDGLNYNRTLEARRAQAALGWRNTLSVQVRDGAVDLTARYVDRTGTPLENLAVQATLRRPTQEGFDQTLDMTNQGNGTYGAHALLPLPGQWQVRLTARLGSREVFHSESRIWSQP